MRITKLSKRTIPLCLLPSGKLVCYKDGNILLLVNDKTELSIPIHISKKEHILGKCTFLFRLFRMGVRAAEALDEDHVLLSIGNMVYEMDLRTGAISNGFHCGAGIRPLAFTKVEGINGIEDGIYFGGYLSNCLKKPVSIYKRNAVDQWDVIYTFAAGEINHVHLIVQDSFRNCLWIFTGDFDESAAIWKVSDNFKKVERFVCNDQKYRGCVVFSLPEGLLYATDAPFAENFIYLLNPDTKMVKKVAPIDGSCIYGCKWKESYVFSSTVEGDGRNMSRYEFYFGRKRGAGIKDDFVHIYCGDLNDGFKEIYKEKKDIMPFYTFQFGVFKFPFGVNKTDKLYFQPVATSKNDLNLMYIQ